MVFGGCLKRGFAALVLLLCLAPPAAAQLNEQLSAYTGANATGYLQPLADAIGANLNAGIFRTASIPRMAPKIRIELEVMSVFFGDDDRTFRAVTERGFTPVQYADAPTAVGSTEAVIVEGDAGTAFAFPGGLDLNSFALAAPQIRVGGLFGTELIVRYYAMNISESESEDSSDDNLGDISLFGIGAKHSISQYLPAPFPVDLSAGFFWQTFDVGENARGDRLISSKALSIGVQASKMVVRFVEPYAGLSYDTHTLDVSYDSEEDGVTTTNDIDFEKDSTLHLTLGLMLEFPVAKGFIEYNVAGMNSFSFGIALGM